MLFLVGSVAKLLFLWDLYIVKLLFLAGSVEKLLLLVGSVEKLLLLAGSVEKLLLVGGIC